MLSETFFRRALHQEVTGRNKMKGAHNKNAPIGALGTWKSVGKAAKPAHGRTRAQSFLSFSLS
jgi:hypothetical protein